MSIGHFSVDMCNSYIRISIVQQNFGNVVGHAPEAGKCRMGSPLYFKRLRAIAGEVECLTLAKKSSNRRFGGSFLYSASIDRDKSKSESDRTREDVLPQSDRLE